MTLILEWGKDWLSKPQLHSLDPKPKRCHLQRFAREDGALLKPKSLDNRRNRPPVSTGGSFCAGLLLV